MYYTSDITVLCQLFLNSTENIVIFHSDNQLIKDDNLKFDTKNVTTESIVILLSKPNQKFPFKHCIDFTNHSFTNDRTVVYQYFNNPNDTMRWIYPKSLKYPSFLTLYNASGMKSKLIRLAFANAFRFGLKSKLSSGSFQLVTNGENAVEILVKEAKGENYSIFTGTVGENRKAIIEINQNRKTTNFIKVPLGEKSAKLVAQEKNQLKKFNQLNFQKSVIPIVTSSKNPKVAIISNVQPSESFSTLNDLTAVHLNVLKEWYDKTNTLKSIDELPEYQQIQNNLQVLENDLKPVNDLKIETVTALYKGLKTFQSTIDHRDFGTSESQKITVGLAHYDFTPWNMYVTKSRLHIYDWELSQTDLPLLYDAFHFIFQSSILIKRSSFEEIQQQVNQLKNSDLVKTLGQDANFDFDTNYRFYILSVASYYLKLYIKQSPLHVQAHWLVDTWLEAVEN
ncbi:MAG: hypothetical protein AB8G11_06565 [Saprospiraceae bacterium]